MSWSDEEDGRKRAVLSSDRNQEERAQLQAELADIAHDRYGVQVTGGDLRDDGGIDIPLTWDGAAKMLADPRAFERLQPLLGRCLSRLDGSDRGAKCEAKIWHGPGHQSTTTCRLRGEHTVHEAIYGSYDQVAHWIGDEAHSGFMDDPPSEDDTLEQALCAQEEAARAVSRVLLDDLRRELGQETELVGGFLREGGS